MMDIAILDDEEAILKDIKICVEKEVSTTDEVNLFTYTSVNEFLKETESGHEFDILISDILMPEMNGLDMGRRLREQGIRTYLIYLTSYTEYAVDSYRVEAYQYILKEEMERRLPRILRKLINLVKKEKLQFRLIGTPTNKVTIYYKDIIYIEKENRHKYIQYVTVHGTYRERITLAQLLKELNSEEFIMVERSCIININHIVSMQKTILMDNDKEIIVSRNYFKEVRERIHLYRGKM